jgi:hypothetical protein
VILNTDAGISAVLLPRDDLESAVLDLAVVLEGLCADRFEIIVVGYHPSLEDVRARAPRLPLRALDGDSIVDGCNAARYELILVASDDGQFDVRELNHLLEAVEAGADVAAGYRPKRMDGLKRQFQRWGWNVDVDCAFVLLRRQVWQAVAATQERTWCCATLLAGVRHLGYRVAEVPVSHKRPTIGMPTATAA